MSRKKGVVETRAAACLLAALAAACVHIEPDPDPFDIQASGVPIPEGVDYLRAVQCGGLLWALQAIEYRTTRAKGLSSMTDLYLEWARQLAMQAGENPALAKPDMVTSRDMILAA